MEQKKWMKKSIAVVAAAVLGISSSATVAFGADTYQSVEKAALAEKASEFAAAYANSLKSMEVLSPGVGADMTLQLSDTGKAMLGSIIGMDLSWADSVKMTMNATMKDGKEAAATEISLNDTKLCTMNTYVDMATGDTYVEIPDLADGYLLSNTADAAQTLEESGDSSASTALAQEMSSKQALAILSLMTQGAENMPEASVVEDMLNNYGGLIIEGSTDGEGTEEPLTVDSVSQDCTVYESQLDGKQATDMVTNILNTAKEDTQLKDVLEKWSKALPDSENLYDDFLKGIENTLKDIEASSQDTDDGVLISKIWVGENGKIVGRQLTLDTVSAQPLLTYQMPRKDGTYGYLLEVGTDSETVNVKGNGTYADSKMNGTFEIGLGADSMFSVEMTDYDTASMKEGYWNGSYAVTLLPGLVNDDNTYNIMKDFGITMTTQSAQESGDVELALTYAGEALGTLSMVSKAGSEVAYPDFATAENVYNANDTDAVNTYMSGFDYETLLNNLTAAGLPEELINSMMGVEADTTDGTAATEDTTETTADTTADAETTADTAEAAAE